MGRGLSKIYEVDITQVARLREGFDEQVRRTPHRIFESSVVRHGRRTLEKRDDVDLARSSCGVDSLDEAAVDPLKTSGHAKCLKIGTVAQKSLEVSSAILN